MHGTLLPHPISSSDFSKGHVPRLTCSHHNPHHSLPSARSLHLCEQLLLYCVQQAGTKVAWVEQNVMLEGNLCERTQRALFRNNSAKLSQRTRLLSKVGNNRPSTDQLTWKNMLSPFPTNCTSFKSTPWQFQNHGTERNVNMAAGLRAWAGR